MSIFSKALRIGEGKRLRELEQLAEDVNALEPDVEQLSDEELAARTPWFRERLEAGETLDDIEIEAYATVREAAKRVLGQRHYDVQVVGAGTLHRGMIAEMKTGEGKTLVATMPAYLNALSGGGVHIVTVNDYLASRDAEWMGSIHRFGFDYLRDNMTMTPEHMVQKGHAFAIVDEVDSILVDEARTPLIISGRVGETGKWYTEFSRIASRLRIEDHYEVDEKKRQVITTEAGVTRVEEILGIENMYDFANVDFIHHLDVAEGRRYSEGLHQAIEAKEGVRIKEENQTLATITLQNYFRMYEKLSGMTGTAITEEGEFVEIYGLQVVVIPTNEPIARMDEGDVVYVDEDHKFAALADDIEARNAKGQPVLVGTVSIEKSERVADTLKRRGIGFEVLNAKQHEREAHIVAQAGMPGAITVATNMAGRGVDIQLGGNPVELAKDAMLRKDISPDDDGYGQAYEVALAASTAETQTDRQRVLDAGGLYVLGTERHESRRIDNQLRGRSGRQGDPGESRFYLSLEDDLMRRFANERVASIMSRLKIPPDVPIEARMVSKAIERAQTQVESQNFEIRKNVLKYDEVMNTQRRIIYQWRNQILHGDSTEELLSEWREDVVEDAVHEMADGIDPSEWDWDELHTRLAELYPTKLGRDSFDRPQDLLAEEVVDAYLAEAADAYLAREADLTTPVIRSLERTVVLSVIDNKWREHLAEMDYLRSGIGLRAMGQRDPLVEYQREGFSFFEDLVHTTKADSIRYMFHVEVARREEQPRARSLMTSSAKGDGTTQRQVRREGDKIGRNAPCPCGSGKKYKRCHGAPGAEPLPA